MIKNLLFDLGGVIMDIQRFNAVESLKKIGITNADQLLGKYTQKGPFLKLEEGLISPSEFRNAIREGANVKITDNEIDNAFCNFLTGIPAKRLSDLEQLKQEGFNIYMLSNTNPIMWDSRIADEFKKAGHDLNHYFDGTVTSFEAKVCKPDAAIFDYAIKKLNIVPAETLFLDDSQKNVEAARQLGFNAEVINPGEEFSAIIKQFIQNN
ncbi:MAG: HAD family phosphatase [Muribaculaceae bacterium]|nr:HAD family phosphatase [Muribaculaceae bacterium]